jgi:hypothetical protein
MVGRQFHPLALGKGVSALPASIALAFVLTACGGGGTKDAAAPSNSSAPSFSSPSQAAPTTVDPLAADQALVRTLYYDQTKAFERSLQAGAEFFAAHNHPQYAYTAQECLSFMQAGGGLTKDCRFEVVPDVASMALDPGWVLPEGSGRYAGLAPKGRIYILPVEMNETDPGAGINDKRTSQVHAAIVDSKAYYFMQCEDVG